MRGPTLCATRDLPNAISLELPYWIAWLCISWVGSARPSGRSRGVAELDDREESQTARRCRARTILVDGALEHRLVEMVAATLTGTGGGVGVDSGGRGGPLSGPRAASVRILAGERSGELDPSAAVAEIDLMLRPHVLDVPGHRVFTAVGSMITWSLRPLPRGTIWLVAQSTSLTRSRQRSSKRSPAP